MANVATIWLVIIVLVSVSLYAMTRLIEKVFRNNGISLWPSASTFIAFVIVSVGGGLLWGIEDVIQLDFANAIEFIPIVAIFGVFPAVFVWVGARNRARRLPNPPERLSPRPMPDAGGQALMSRRGWHILWIVVSITWPLIAIIVVGLFGGFDDVGFFSGFLFLLLPFALAVMGLVSAGLYLLGWLVATLGRDDSPEPRNNP